MPQNVKEEDGLKIVGQEDRMNAIRSIPSYLERTDLILVMAPPASHADTGSACNYRSWRSRG